MYDIIFIEHIFYKDSGQTHCLEPGPSRYRDEKLTTRPQRLCVRGHQLNELYYEFEVFAESLKRPK